MKANTRIRFFAIVFLFTIGYLVGGGLRKTIIQFMKGPESIMKTSSHKIQTISYDLTQFG